MARLCRDKFAFVTNTSTATGVQLNMKHTPLLSLCKTVALVVAMLPASTRSTAGEPPVPQSSDLSPEEAKDAYAIYSMLLPVEVPKEWKITEWAISQQTQTFPNMGEFHNVRECLNFPRDQEAVYSPLIDDYMTKNNRAHTLGRNFDLPQYTLVDFWRASGSTSAISVLFGVSAVGFNKERTRALVYVGHHCGSLCGGGGYHLLVKKDGRWQVDREFRGMSCLWVS
jgi:hypothetical protein